MERIERPRAFAVGLDLGQASDFTAIVVDELVRLPDGPSAPPTVVDLGPFKISRAAPAQTPTFEHHFRHIQRFALKSSYPDIVRRVGEIVTGLKSLGRIVLVIDQTGVGRAVFDMFVQARYGVPLCGVTITGGHQAIQDPERPSLWTVPKKDLVGVLQSQFHQEHIKIARSLPEAKALLNELQNFRMKITAAANVMFEAWRDGDKDDLVLASALAVWGGMRMTRGGGLY